MINGAEGMGPALARQFRQQLPNTQHQYYYGPTGVPLHFILMLGLADDMLVLTKAWALDWPTLFCICETALQLQVQGCQAVDYQ